MKTHMQPPWLLSRKMKRKWLEKSIFLSFFLGDILINYCHKLSHVLIALMQGALTSTCGGFFDFCLKKSSHYFNMKTIGNPPPSII